MSEETWNYPDPQYLWEHPLQKNPFSEPSDPHRLFIFDTMVVHYPCPDDLDFISRSIEMGRNWEMGATEQLEKNEERISLLDVK